jgi:hypothetical protein
MFLQATHASHSTAYTAFSQKELEANTTLDLFVQDCQRFDGTCLTSRVTILVCIVVVTNNVRCALAENQNLTTLINTDFLVFFNKTSLENNTLSGELFPCWSVKFSGVYLYHLPTRIRHNEDLLKFHRVE